MVWGVLWSAEIIFAARKKGGGNDDWIIDDGAAFAWYASPRRGLTGRALRYWLICFPCNKSRGWRPARWLGYQYYHSSIRNLTAAGWESYFTKTYWTNPLSRYIRQLHRSSAMPISQVLCRLLFASISSI
mmetsp:Transcript_40122/g.72291  ORF Transcript_40122/g.72291 Transcript_40122/m.72291 type:complete len:130 (-) Transcript_40122:1028-1417(-)